MKKRILTVSSANMDFVMKVARVPEAGQTLLDDGSFRFVPGGKGANAAVAIQRLVGDRRQRSYLRHRFSALPFRHSLIRIMQLLREVELRHPF